MPEVEVEAQMVDVHRVVQSEAVVADVDSVQYRPDDFLAPVQGFLLCLVQVCREIG